MKNSLNLRNWRRYNPLYESTQNLNHSPTKTELFPGFMN